MSWNMLNNGVCPPEIEPLGFRDITAGTENLAAIDSVGRLYTWGSASYTYLGQTPVPIASTPNFSPHPAWNNNEIQRPYQVGTKSNWVKVDFAERLHMAMDEDGYLYAWGEAYDNGVGGWSETDKYDRSVGNIFVPGGSLALEPTLVNNVQWKDFANGFYHAVGLKQDGTLWIWGTNYDSTYGTALYAEGYVSLIPIQMTWLPFSVKLVSAHYSVTAVVTDDDEVWIWGDFSRDNFEDYNYPTHIPLTLPVGVTIVKLACSYFGVTVLLSNGKVYCQGDEISFGTGSFISTDFVAEPDNHVFIDIDMGQSCVLAIDVNGDAWMWGHMIYGVFVPHDTIADECDYQHSIQFPTLAFGVTPGQYRWVLAAAGDWTYVMVDDAGNLYTQGENAYAELGTGLRESELDHSCVPILTAGIRLDDGTPLGVPAIDASVISTARYEVINSPVQASEHNPCGHWHRRLRFDANESGISTCNCWNFGLAISGTNILFVSCGIYMPHQCVFFRYNLSTRIWGGPYYEVENFTAAQNVTGAATNGNWDVAISYGGDSSGNKFSPVITNRRARFISVDHTNVKISTVNFPAAVPQDFDDQIINYDAGNLCLILVRNVAGGYVLHYSVDRGVSFGVATTFTEASGISKAKLARGDNIYYAGVFNSGGNLVRLHTSSDGISWAEKAVIPVGSGNNDFDLIADGDSVYIVTRDAHFYYSHNRGDSFQNKLIHAPTSYAAASENSKAALFFYNASLERTDNYETMEDVVDVVPDEEYKITFFTVLASSGDFVTYMRDNLFIESRIVLPVSQNMGLTWELVPSPLDYFKDQLSVEAGPDDPRWKFVEAAEKFRLDPQYT